VVKIGFFTACSRQPPQADLTSIAAQNVLLITIDTLRADALGSYGGQAATPALDRLAAEGVRFTFAHAHAVTTLSAHASILTGLLPRVRDIRRYGAASLDLCAVAEGLVDAYYEKGLAAWDMAAGGLIALEAGVLVTGLRGAPPSSVMVVAAPPAIHGPLHDLLVELDADSGP